MSGSDPRAKRDDVFESTRTFDAPRALVWKAWTEPTRIAAWLGPKGTEDVHVLRHDLRPGGEFLASMITNGQKVWGKHVYREVEPTSRLVRVHSFSDQNGALVRHPMASTWPLEMLTTVTLEDHGDKTMLTLRWVPINATDDERKTFRDAKQGMQAGWTSSFDQLSEHLARG
jgi:uncharacterized protein YndB with AHSA1/START domain